MNGITIPFLPTSLWMIATALALIIVFLSFAHYLFYRQRIQAVCDDAGDAAELAARKEQLHADVNSLRQWIENQKAELERIRAEREEQERLRVELSSLEQQVLTQDQKNEHLRKEVGELESQRYLLSQAQDKLKKEVGDLEAQRKTAASLRTELSELERKLEDAKSEISSQAGIEARIVALKAEEEAIKNRIRELHTSLEDTNSKLDVMRQETAGIERQREETRQKLERDRHKRDEIDRELQYLNNKLEALRNSAVFYEHEIKKFQAEEKEYESLKEKLKQLKNEISNKQQVFSDLAAAEVKLITLNAKKTVLEEKIREIEAQLDGSTAVDKPTLSAYADLIEVPCNCVSKKAFTKARGEDHEWTVLEEFREALDSENLKFPNRVIDAFHTSLKCQDINPLTVLAGVSGTGKTLLPIYYARFIGMHSLVMSVQPRWDSPQDMFGFYNYIEKQYKATDLARALILMDPYNSQHEAFKNIGGDWTRDRILLVLLDEMNLARTEYYFSDFLSKLELRRLVKNPEKPEERENAEIELDTGPNKGMEFRFWVSQNIFFVGTMNEDETTQTLSDKVLDRANVLRFGKPDTRLMAADSSVTEENFIDADKYLSFKTWKAWHREYNAQAPWSEEVIKWLGNINEAMDKIGRPFGYRVHQAVTTYVANYPRVQHEDRFKLAFADQIEQKIIPKLRGSEISNPNAEECLNIIHSIVKELDDNELETSFDQALEESENVGLFQWRGVTRTLEEDE